MPDEGEVDLSLWLDGARRSYPPLARDASADVAVVGGGIAGVATAYFLAGAGARVVLLEARGIAEGASGRNAGFILAGVAENFAAACRRYGEERATRIWKVTKRTQDLVRSLVAQRGIACELAWNGSLQIAGDEDEWSEIKESVRRLRALGVEGTLDPASRSACYPGDGEFHPVRFVRGLAAAAASHGASLHESTEVTAVGDGVIRTTQASVRAGAVVLCTNAYTAHLVPSRVRPVRGQILATAPTTRVFDRPAYANRGYRYWRQTADGRVIVGGWRDEAVDEEVGEEERTTPFIQSRLDAFLRERRIAATVTHRWAGIMGFSHDALPYVGRVAPRILVCGGFSGHGMAFGPASAELVAALTRGESHPDADLFDPAREPVRADRYPQAPGKRAR